MIDLPEKLTLAEIEEGLAYFTQLANRYNAGLTKLAEAAVEIRSALDENAKVLAELEARKALLSDEELAGDYVVVHGSYGDKPTGSIVHLEGKEARSLLSHGVVAPYVAPPPTDEQIIASVATPLDPPPPAADPNQQPLPVDKTGLDETKLPKLAPADNVEKTGITVPADGTMHEVIGDGTGAKLPAVDAAEQDAIADELGVPHPTLVPDPTATAAAAEQAITDTTVTATDTEPPAS